MRASPLPAHVKAADDYLELVKRFPLRTLRSDREHLEAVKILSRLLGRPDGGISAGERDYADVLGRLIDDYGQKRHPRVRLNHTPLEMLRYLMEQNNMNVADLGKVLGNKTAASLVLSGKRELSKAHIRKLSARFKVDPGLFF